MSEKDNAVAQAVRAEVATGPCGQCKDTRQPCSCMIDTMLKERGLVAVDAAHYDKISARAKSAPAHPAEGVPEDGFELWWADHMPKSTQTEAWSAWIALHQSTHPTQQGLDVRDASRYRFASKQDNFCDFVIHAFGCYCDDKESADRVIDAALAAQAKQGGQA